MNSSWSRIVYSFECSIDFSNLVEINNNNFFIAILFELGIYIYIYFITIICFSAIRELIN